MSPTQLLARRFKVWARDRHFPTHVFKIKTEDGYLSYAKNDQVGKKLWFRGGYETDERRILRTLCRAAGSGFVFFDIGANSGLFSLLAAKSHPEAQVHAFEASQFEFRKLVNMVEWNRLANIRLNNAAVSNADGYLTIYETYSGGGALNRIDGPHKANGRFREAIVPALTVDHYVKANSLSRLDFVKLDVEGHETPVLEGARETIARFEPILLIECEAGRSSVSSSPEKIFRLMAEFHAAEYGCFRASEQTFTQPSKMAEGNVFFVPQKKQNAVAKTLGWFDARVPARAVEHFSMKHRNRTAA